MKVVAVLALTVLQLGWAIDCDCGFEDVGGVCTLEPGLNVSLTPGRQCELPTDRFCDVDEDAGSAECVCGCGWEGDNCDVKVDVDAAYKAIAIIIPAVPLIGILIWLYRRDKKNNGSDWDIPSSACVTSPYSWCKPQYLLVYRGVVAITAVGIYIDQMADRPRVLATFTVWNWMLVTAYFCLGFVLSVRNQLHPVEGDRLSYLERVFYILMVVETVSSVLVSVVFWGILFPTSPPVLVPFLTGYTSIFQHALNVPLMWTDFLLISLPIILPHYGYVVVFAAVYSVFHGFYVIHGLTLTNDYTCPVYFFLAIDSPLLIVWIIGLLIAYFVFYYFGYRASLWKIRMQGGAENSGKAVKTESL